MKALKLQFSSVSTEASGFESMFSIPSSTINLLKVGSSRGLDKIDESNLTIEEYIELEAEKACRRGQTFNWKTATYSKVRYHENIDYFKDFETYFLAIIYNNALTNNHEVSSKPTVRPLDNNEIDFRISFDESEDEYYIWIFEKNVFSYKLISVNDSKMDSEKDIDEVNLPHNNVEQLDNDYNVDTQFHEFNENFETNHDIYQESFNMEENFIIIEVMIQKRFYEGMLLIFINKNLYVSFGIPFDPKRFYKDGVCTRKLRRVRFADTVLDLEDAGTFSFQLGGARRQMNWRQFVLALGLHTAEEIDTDNQGSVEEIVSMIDCSHYCWERIGT
ncbi:hypothetical protein Tco_0952599 [Tanacetum coccineum]|uniref:Uncharacterized protein n=1 Tax=Tanacetum coccineum TaxID=301880 RepID=A0ABQ5E3J1_9ASTR